MTTTQQVQVLLNGTNIPINVSAANLSTDITTKDFVVVVDGAIVPNTNYVKTSQTTLNYTGASVTNQNTIIRRKTPAVQMHTVDYSKRISSNDWSDELDRLYRRLVELELFGYNYLGGFIGAGNATVNNQPFGVDWSTDTSGTATRKALYDKFSAQDAAITALNNTLSTLSTNVNNNASNITSLSSTVSSLISSVSSLQSTQTSHGNRLTTLETRRLNDTVVIARRSGTSNQNLTANTLTTLIFDSEVLDTQGGMYNPANGSITPGVTRWYEISVSAYFTASSAISTGSLGYLVNVTDNVNHELLGFIDVGNTDGSCTWVIQTQLVAGKTYQVRALIAATAPIMAGAVTVPARLVIKSID